MNTQFLSAPRLNRRTLVGSGAALGAGLAVGGSLLRVGDVFAQDATATTSTATTAIVSAANAFLETLSADEQAAVLFDWSDTAQRQRWSNFPEGLFERDGLMWGNLSEETQDAWLAIMQATLSEEGYNRVLAEWYADQVLADSGGGQGSLGLAYYWIAIIGTPSETEPWQWQFGGHHITINVTVVGSNIALTPSFIGVQPGTYTDDSGATVRPIGDIEDAAFSLVNALDADQQAVAIQGDQYINLILGPGEDGKAVEAEGLAASEMTEEQQAILLELIGYYAGLVHDEAASARLEEITASLTETYFVWYGPTEPGSAAYFRVAGPNVVIEYSPQQLGGDPANHIHGIYRDPGNDYGSRYTGVEVV